LAHSPRYHFGFITQEVSEALEFAGLSSNDFAALCQDGYGTENPGYWYLRKDELISLNTWQIQKLKARVSELEEQMAKLSNQS
jgi:hypothetical protein